MLDEAGPHRRSELRATCKASSTAIPLSRAAKSKFRQLNGVVTLSGDVTSDTERAAAASDAATVEGVRTVVNNLQVQQAAMTPPRAAAVQRPPAHKKPSNGENKSEAAEQAPPAP